MTKPYRVPQKLETSDCVAKSYNQGRNKGGTIPWRSATMGVPNHCGGAVWLWRAAAEKSQQ